MNNFDKYDEYANITKEITDKYIMLKKWEEWTFDRSQCCLGIVEKSVEQIRTLLPDKDKLMSLTKEEYNDMFEAINAIRSVIGILEGELKLYKQRYEDTYKSMTSVTEEMING